MRWRRINHDEQGHDEQGHDEQGHDEQGGAPLVAMAKQELERACADVNAWAAR
jgi:hypothetical protein